MSKAAKGLTQIYMQLIFIANHWNILCVLNRRENQPIDLWANAGGLCEKLLSPPLPL